MILLSHSLERIEVDVGAFRFGVGFLGAVERDLTARCVWYYGRVTRRLLMRSLFLEGAGATMALRMGEMLRRSVLFRWLGHLVFASLRRSCHIVVGRGATFGPGLVLLHPHGIFIHTTVRAGANLILQNDITLGGEDDKGPVLGDNVFVGVGARIIGPVTIGNRCRIGANAVVMSSVPDGHVAVGNPARMMPIQTGAGKDGHGPTRTAPHDLCGAGRRLWQDLKS